MVKSELIEHVASQQRHLLVRDVELAVNQILECITEALCHGGRVEIRGFGSFCLHHRPARNAHNPKTGEKVATIAKHTPHFKPGKELRDRVNERFLQERAKRGEAE